MELKISREPPQVIINCISFIKLLECFDDFLHDIRSLQQERPNDLVLDLIDDAVYNLDMLLIECKDDMRYFLDG